MQRCALQKSARFCHVPDGGNARLIAACVADPEIECVTLTTEEDGVAQTCGAWLGGDRSVLLMQSSRVGNCINMLSMVRTSAFPSLTLVSMRGQWGEFMPWAAHTEPRPLGSGDL